MKAFWLFRTNLRQYEYYHSINNLDQFKKECHDFYLLMGIWMLENTELEEFVVWRLKPSKPKVLADRWEKYIFDVNGKKFIQIFADRFEDSFYFPKPDITLFRGGFPEYAKITKDNPAFFGLKLYLGAGQRVYPKYGGIYDKILVEDERDLHPNFDCIPFYKTANHNIFYPMDIEKKWDICWPCNFSQFKYKGQEWFIKKISESDYLKSLKIVHLGNKPEEGIKLCQEHDVYNIEFKGWVTRPELNKYLNQSKIGLVTSNELDGSPRVITEILSSGVTLLLRNDTRCLDDYFDMPECSGKQETQNKYKDIEDKISAIKGLFSVNPTDLIINYGSLDQICQKNIEQWR